MAIFFRMTRRELDERRRALAIEEQEVRQARAAAEKKIAKARSQLDGDERALVERNERFQTLLRSRTEAYPLIAAAWAEWELARAKDEAHYLRNKKHPAKSAAQLVKDKGMEMADLRRRMKVAEYVAQLYEFHFPWIADLRDLDAELDYTATAGEGEPDTEDPSPRILFSLAEWSQLTECERNQRALDRYLSGRQTPWQLGRDYERYIGYLREQAGCAVTYHGIFKASRTSGVTSGEREGRTIEVIQCKRWAQQKTIHEKQSSSSTERWSWPNRAPRQGGQRHLHDHDEALRRARQVAA